MNPFHLYQLSNKTLISNEPGVVRKVFAYKIIYLGNIYRAKIQSKHNSPIIEA